MEKILHMIEYLYAQGKEKFKVKDSNGVVLYNHAARIARNAVAYEICIENNIYPDFFCTLCRTHADDQFHRGNGPIQLSKAISILETALEHGSGQVGYDSLEKYVETLRRRLDEYQKEDDGIIPQAMDRIDGYDKIEPYLKSCGKFHDSRILEIHYDADKAEISAQFLICTFDPDCPTLVASLLFDGVHKFECDTDNDNDYNWSMRTNIMDHSLVVTFDSGYYRITCDGMEFLDVKNGEEI